MFRKIESMEEEENISKKKSYTLGNNLDQLSIEDLRSVLTSLNEEIVRLKDEINKKIKAKNVAAKFFK